MRRVKYIFRVICLLLAIFLLFYINKQTNRNAETIAEFKFKMYRQLQTDTLDNKQRLALLQKETTRFIDSSSRVKQGIQYLMGLLGILVVGELCLSIWQKKSQQQVD